MNDGLISSFAYWTDRIQSEVSSSSLVISQELIVGTKPQKSSGALTSRPIPNDFPVLLQVKIVLIG